MYQFPQMLTSCMIIVKYHNSEIDISTSRYRTEHFHHQKDFYNDNYFPFTTSVTLTLSNY